MIVLSLYEVVFKEFWDLQKEVVQGFLGEVFPYMAYAYAFPYSGGTEDVFVVNILWAKDFLLVNGFILINSLNIFLEVVYVPSSFLQVETMGRCSQTKVGFVLPVEGVML